MKTLLIPVCISALMACSNNSNNTSNANDSAHTAHPATSGTLSENVMKRIMDSMMNEMHAAKPVGNNDVDFSQMMIIHHKGAVEMAEALLERWNDPELKRFAQMVINDQNKEIDFMKGIISSSAKDRSANTAEFQKALNNSMMSMMKDNIVVYNNIDKDFAAQMIPHHQSAVDMAEAYLDFGETRELVTLCRSIIENQSKEIDMLKKWLAINS